MNASRGPLSGLRIIELAGIGPGPFCAMMLADHGAEVIRVERPGGIKIGTIREPASDPLRRSRKWIRIDLKQPEGKAVVRDLCRTADGLVEGYRPGVMERLGLGPEALLADNPRLVYGRMTGWGQTGPYAQAAGHDINYIALAGALHAFGRAGDKPTPPINLVGDFGGGGMMLAFGMLAAILHAQRTGEGQVIDCAMTDGSALLMAMIWGLRAEGAWRDERGVNQLDTGAHFYDTYECADGRFISVGAIEPHFYAELRRRGGFADNPDFDPQLDRSCWPALKDKLAAVFKAKTRDEWCALLEYSDACFAPVLSMSEAPDHPHHLERGTFAAVGGKIQPMPAPRYSRTVTAAPVAPAPDQDDAADLLSAIGYDGDQVLELRRCGAIA